MLITDYVDKLLVASKLPTNVIMVDSTDNKTVFKLTGKKLPLPIEVKYNLRTTHYADNLVDSDNNSIEFIFKNLSVGMDTVNCFIKFDYVGTNEYTITYQLLSKVLFDDLGNKYYE